MIKRTDNMTSLSPSKDARRKSPRKTAGEMLQCLAREYKENKRAQGRKKSGGDGKKQARDTGGKVGSKEKPLIYWSSSSLLDKDSYTNVIVPMNKSRRAKSTPTSGGGSLLEFQGWPKGGKRGESE